MKRHNNMEILKRIFRFNLRIRRRKKIVCIYERLGRENCSYGILVITTHPQKFTQMFFIVEVFEQKLRQLFF